MPQPKLSQSQLNQVVVGASLGDAVTDHALVIRDWLRGWGFQSQLYALHIHPALASEVKPLSAYHPGRGERHLIFHHSIGSETVDVLTNLPVELILIYHNITPAGFFTYADPMWTRLLTQGRQQLHQLRPHTRLGLAVSEFNAAELRDAGYQPTGVLPIMLDESRYTIPLNDNLAASLRAQRPLLLFVGKFAPHKKQEDLVKLLFHYRQLAPHARLALVGDPWLPDYTAWLNDMIRRLGLTEAVLLPGRVNQQDMVTYYRCADLFVSMSEHEGFCKPLIESMYLALPILAYASTAVPGTLGQTGILFHDKDYEALAELVDILQHDHALRQRLIQRQQAHVQQFLAPAIRATLQQHLQTLGVLAP